MSKNLDKRSSLVGGNLGVHFGTAVDVARSALGEHPGFSIGVDRKNRVYSTIVGSETIRSTSEAPVALIKHIVNDKSGNQENVVGGLVVDGKGELNLHLLARHKPVSEAIRSVFERSHKFSGLKVNLISH